MRRSPPLGPRLAFAACGALVLACGLAGCRQLEQPWNVLLVTFDTTRADRIGCYGNGRIETPTLDRLAAEGVRFAHATSAAPITAPSHSTILTGRYPIAHGVRDNGLFVLGGEQLTLAEILGRHGYATAAAVGAYPLVARFGFDQGFDLFDDHLTAAFEDHLGRRVAPKERLFFDERRAAQVNEAVLPWLLEHAADPFFLWVHYFDPHQPFEPAPPFDQVYADDLYDGEIAYADSRLGLLLDRLESLGALDRTLVIMTADHGEGLGEHDELTHAVLAYDSTLHVPLIVRPPLAGARATGRNPPSQGTSSRSTVASATVARGRVVEERVGTVDVVPTVLDLLGLEAPAGLQGRSLAPLLRGDDTTADRGPRLLYAENLSPRLTHGWGELRVLREGPLKYIHGPHPELYDLDDDPHELHDLSEQRADEATRLRSSLVDFLAENAVPGASTAEALDAEVRQRLEALGYLHTAADTERTVTDELVDDGIDPRQRVGNLNDLSAAKHLLFKGRASEALHYTRRLIAGDGSSPLFLELHAVALTETGRLEEAGELVDRLSERGPVSEPLVLRLAARRFENGESRDALDSLRKHLARSPSAPGQWLLSSFHHRLGDDAASRDALEEALRLDPAFAPAEVDLAVRLAQAGDAQAAEQRFHEALTHAPYYPKAAYNYGTFLLQGERPNEAVGYFDRAIALAPRYLKAHLALVAAHALSGDPARARGAYEVLHELAPGSDEATTAAGLLTVSSSEPPSAAGEPEAKTPRAPATGARRLPESSDRRVGS